MGVGGECLAGGGRYRLRRLSVGLVSPLPPARSGIADYSAELLVPLRAFADVREYEPRRAAEALRSGHDVLLFQIGNDPLHAPSVEALAQRGKTPAVVVLHDFVLHHLFAAAYLDRGRVREYAQLLARCHGERGRRLGELALRGERDPVWDLEPWAYPLSQTVVADATALIVHSRLVRGAVLREAPGAHVVEIPHHVVPAPRTPTAQARHELGLPSDRAVAVTLGIVTPAKRVGKVLEALALVPTGRRPFLFVGGALVESDPLRAQAKTLGLAGDVAFGGYLSEEDFWKAASAADLAVNLRYPTMGETSGAVCRLAGFGLPVLVSDVGWFRELPSSFASKIPVGSGEVERLAEELSRCGERERASERAAAARAWGEARSPELVARAYAEVLEEAAAGWATPLGISGALAAELSALGVGRPGGLGASSRHPDALLVADVAGLAAPFLPVRSGSELEDAPGARPA